jgi:hypothetical protein
MHPARHPRVRGNWEAGKERHSNGPVNVTLVRGVAALDQPFPGGEALVFAVRRGEAIVFAIGFELAFRIGA